MCRYDVNVLLLMLKLVGFFQVPQCLPLAASNVSVATPARTSASGLNYIIIFNYFRHKILPAPTQSFQLLVID